VADRGRHPLAADLDHALDRAAPAWEALRGARLFVTGGTGFIGTWLLESFVWANARLALGARLVALTREPAAFAARAPHLATDRSIELFRGDVRRYEAPPGPFSHVVHGATSSSATLNAERPLEMLDTIVDGTRHTLEVAQGAGAERVLLLSSGAVYGRQPPTLTHVTEEHTGGPDPLDPANAYAEGKRTAELLAAMWSRRGNVGATIARCFAFVGPHLPLDAHFAIGNFIGDALHRRPIRLSGDGSPYRSYLYAADLTVWLWTILVRGTAGRVYNVGSERGMPLWETARVVHQALREEGAQPPVRAREPDPAAPAPRYVPSTRRAREELGVAEWVGLEDAVRRTWAWHANRHEASPGRVRRRRRGSRAAR
jgi:nucleoside-diphosphate-sugar epimerase